MPLDTPGISAREVYMRAGRAARIRYNKRSRSPEPQVKVGSYASKARMAAAAGYMSPQTLANFMRTDVGRLIDAVTRIARWWRARLNP